MAIDDFTKRRIHTAVRNNFGTDIPDLATFIPWLWLRVRVWVSDATGPPTSEYPTAEDVAATGFAFAYGPPIEGNIFEDKTCHCGYGLPPDVVLKHLIAEAEFPPVSDSQDPPLEFQRAVERCVRFGALLPQRGNGWGYQWHSCQVLLENIVRRKALRALHWLRRNLARTSLSESAWLTNELRNLIPMCVFHMLRPDGCACWEFPTALGAAEPRHKAVGVKRCLTHHTLGNWSGCTPLDWFIEDALVASAYAGGEHSVYPQELPRGTLVKFACDGEVRSGQVMRCPECLAGEIQPQTNVCHNLECRQCKVTETDTWLWLHGDRERMKALRGTDDFLRFVVGPWPPGVFPRTGKGRCQPSYPWVRVNFVGGNDGILANTPDDEPNPDSRAELLDELNRMAAEIDGIPNTNIRRRTRVAFDEIHRRLIDYRRGVMNMAENKVTPRQEMADRLATISREYQLNWPHSYNWRDEDQEFGLIVSHEHFRDGHPFPVLALVCGAQLWPALRGGLEWKLLSLDGTVLRNGRSDRETFPLPELPHGNYRLEVRLASTVEPAFSAMPASCIRVQVALAGSTKTDSKVIAEFEGEVTGRPFHAMVIQDNDQELFLSVRVSGTRPPDIRLLKFVVKEASTDASFSVFVGLHELDTHESLAVGEINLGMVARELLASLAEGWELDTKPKAVTPADLSQDDAKWLERSWGASNHPGDQASIRDALNSLAKN